MTSFFKRTYVVLSFCVVLLFSCGEQRSVSNTEDSNCYLLQCGDTTMRQVLGDEFGYEWHMHFGESFASSNVIFKDQIVKDWQDGIEHQVSLFDSLSCRTKSVSAADEGYAQHYFQSLERKFIGEANGVQEWRLWHADDSAAYWVIEIEPSDAYAWPMFGFLKGVPKKILGRRGGVQFEYVRTANCLMNSSRSRDCPEDSLVIESYFPPAYFPGDDVLVLGEVFESGNAQDTILLSNSTIAIFKQEEYLKNIQVSPKGEYEFKLPLGYKYLVEFGSDSFVSKSIEIDTRFVPINQRAGGFMMQVDMSLFKEQPGVDFSILNKPLGKCSYDLKANALIFDFEYTRTIQDSLEVLLSL